VLKRRAYRRNCRGAGWAAVGDGTLSG
jgi:hypothetical protein